jgi:hypothetical protein
MRILQSSPRRIYSPTFENLDGLATDASSPTVVIYDGGGTVLVAETAASTVAGRPGVLSFSLTPTHTAVLDTYKAVWKGTVDAAVQTKSSWYEVAGGFFFSVSEALAEEELSEVSATTILEERERVEDQIENRLGAHFVPRGRRVYLSGRATDQIATGDWFLNEIYSVATIDGALTTSYGVPALADLASGPRLIYSKTGVIFPWGHRNIQMHYSAGMQQTPGPVKEAALKMLVAKLAPNPAVPAGVSQVSVEGYSLSYQKGDLFSVPGVDELLKDYDYRAKVQSIQVGT